MQLPDSKPELTPESAYAALQSWWRQSIQLRAIRTAEVLARKDVVKFYFNKPRIGTNRFEMSGGYDLVLKHQLTYEVDAAALDQIKASEWKKHKLDPDDLITYKPSLNVRAYNALSKEQQAFVDEFITTKENTPQLSIEKRGERTGSYASKPRKAATKKTTRRRK